MYVINLSGKKKSKKPKKPKTLNKSINIYSCQLILFSCFQTGGYSWIEKKLILLGST